MSEKTPEEITLDPEDWDEMRALGHRMIDDIMTYLQTLREKPIYQRFSEKVLNHFSGPPPIDAEEPEKVYQDFLEFVLGTNNTINLHPRDWAFVAGNGTPMGMLGEMLAAGLNQPTEQNMQITYHVEMQVLSWLKEMLGYPKASSGLLVTGASAANLIGLAVARNSRAPEDVRKKGLQNIPKKMTLYGSEEMHSCLQKNVELLGLGDESLRRIKVNKDFQIDVEALKREIRKDRDEGFQPFCVIGNAGTVNTGAFDDLNALADVCAKENLWFHVDGAFGAFAALSPKLKHLVSGMDRADSLAFDLHKWMSVPYGIGCIFIRRLEDHLRSFSISPVYLQSMKDYGLSFSDLGFELSRSTLSLKAWMQIRSHGIDKYRRLVEQNVDQAHYLADLIKAAPELELVIPVSLNVVCFRYVADGLSEDALAELNAKIARQLFLNGVAVTARTVVNGKTAIRACIVNHRSRREDFDLYINEFIRIGNELSKSYRP